MTSTAQFRPRRSCLYMPGANPRALEKAKSLTADMLILDLEDAVAPDAKAEARQVISDAVNERAYGAREVVIRINDLDTQWGHDDLKMAVAARPDGILVPKVISGEQVLEIEGSDEDDRSQRGAQRVPSAGEILAGELLRSWPRVEFSHGKSLHKTRRSG